MVDDHDVEDDLRHPERVREGRSCLRSFEKRCKQSNQTQRIGCFRSISDHFANLVCFVGIIFCEYYV